MTALQNLVHREGRKEREEKLKNLNIRLENLQENLRGFKLSFAASPALAPGASVASSR